MNIVGRIVSDRVKRKSVITLSIYIAAMVVAAVVFSKYVDRESLRAVIQRSGSLGIAVYFLIEVVYVTLTPMFNTAILIASGYIFGGHIGFVINFFSTSFGLFLIVWLVKTYGRPLLQRVVSPQLYNRFDQVTQRVGPLTLLIVYVLPFTPDDELTYIIAAGPIDMKRFLLPIVLGSLAKAAYSYLGDKGTSGITMAAYARIAMLVVGLIAVGVQEYFVGERKSILKVWRLRRWRR